MGGVHQWLSSGLPLRFVWPFKFDFAERTNLSETATANVHLSIIPKNRGLTSDKYSTAMFS